MCIPPTPTPFYSIFSLTLCESNSFLRRERIPICQNKIELYLTLPLTYDGLQGYLLVGDALLSEQVVLSVLPRGKF